MVFSTIHDLDATHTIADVSKDAPQDPGSPRDPDASWGCKGAETKRTVDGVKVKIPKYFLGFKAHLSAETAHGFVTGIHTTPGHVADIDAGDTLSSTECSPMMNEKTLTSFLPIKGMAVLYG